MKKGVFFSIETMYLLVAVFVVLIGMIHFLPTMTNPNYDLISTLKVAHDMGQENTDLPPEDGFGNSKFRVGTVCEENTTVEISYYDYDGAVDKRVCAL
ncbi:hypothetical protein K8R43_00915 [archaeon]|nr:hypothetical protein [archaeon]